MRYITVILAASLAFVAAPATAQSWGGTYDSGYSYGSSGRHENDGYSRRSDWNAVPSTFDWRSQLDRPGDYRCDAFWDASRTDCGDRWRDQRSRVSPQARRDYRQLAGYGRDGYGSSHNDYGHSGGYGRHSYSSGTRGHGSAYGYGGASYNQGGSAYYGAYDRPDVVYPNGGHSYGQSGYGSFGSRAAWCRASYRSYNPHTGYYRAYSGRLIYCG